MQGKGEADTEAINAETTKAEAMNFMSVRGIRRAGFLREKERRCSNSQVEKKECTTCAGKNDEGIELVDERERTRGERERMAGLLPFVCHCSQL